MRIALLHLPLAYNVGDDILKRSNVCYDFRNPLGGYPSIWCHATRPIIAHDVSREQGATVSYIYLYFKGVPGPSAAVTIMLKQLWVAEAVVISVAGKVLRSDGGGCAVV